MLKLPSLVPELPDANRRSMLSYPRSTGRIPALRYVFVFLRIGTYHIHSDDSERYEQTSASAATRMKIAYFLYVLRDPVDTTKLPKDPVTVPPDAWQEGMLSSPGDRASERQNGRAGTSDCDRTKGASALTCARLHATSQHTHHIVVDPSLADICTLRN